MMMKRKKNQKKLYKKNEDEEYIRVLKRKKPVGKKIPTKETKKKVGITKSI